MKETNFRFLYFNLSISILYYFISLFGSLIELLYRLSFKTMLNPATICKMIIIISTSITCKNKLLLECIINNKPLTCCHNTHRVYSVFLHYEYFYFCNYILFTLLLNIYIFLSPPIDHRCLVIFQTVESLWDGPSLGCHIVAEWRGAASILPNLPESLGGRTSAELSESQGPGEIPQYRWPVPPDESPSGNPAAADAQLW